MSFSGLPQFPTADGAVLVATRAQLEGNPAWSKFFSKERKDGRYYRILEETLGQPFDYRYFLLADKSGQVRAVQPFFLLQQDLLHGSEGVFRHTVHILRRAMPRLLTIRTLMVGCVAGEGHLDDGNGQSAEWIGQNLHEALHRYARSIKARMIVLKEFPAEYRPALQTFTVNGYTRVPSLPYTRLNIDYADFEEYMNKTLSKATRKNLRRKFRDAADAGLTMEVTTDVSACAEEVHALYMQVYNRSSLHFEKLTPEYLIRLGREMPDKTRFFIWRQNGKAVAFSLCMINGQTIYDEYVGLDYGVALDLHLYFYTLRDIVQWAIENGFKWYCSSALNYDPKLHLRCDLMPMDLYVSHTSPIANAILRRVLPRLEPTRNDPILQKFANYHEVWGSR